MLLLTESGVGNSDAAEIDEDVLQAQSEAFRTERDLITAEELESLLEQRELTFEHFNDYFIRHGGEKAFGQSAAGEAINYLQAPQTLRDLLRVDLLMGGGFDLLAIHLAWRVIARVATGGEGAQTT